MVWGYIKALLRKICTFKFDELKVNLEEALASIPVSYVRRVANHCLRFMDGYRNRFKGPILDYIVKKYRGHRAIPKIHVDVMLGNRCVIVVRSKCVNVQPGTLLLYSTSY
jgi:hypothetical protein